MYVSFAMDESNSNLTLLFQVWGIGLSVLLPGLLAYVGWGVVRHRGEQRRRRLRRALYAFGVWLLGAGSYYALIFWVYLPGRPNLAQRPGTLTQIGQQAPEFSLVTVDGTPVGPGQMRGRVIVVNFFATWCGPCLVELPELEAIWKEFKGDSNFVLVCVGREESEESIKGFRKKYGFTLPMAADPSSAVYHQFATERIPRTYLLERDGRILCQWTGYYRDELAKLKNLIRKQLKSTAQQPLPSN